MKWAKEILDVMQNSVATGKGAIGVDGKLYDMAHDKLARAILQRSAAIAASLK